MQVIDKELAAERALKTDWRKINKSYRAINRTENVQKRRIVRKNGETLPEIDDADHDSNGMRIL